MKILYAASEAMPFAATGGLGDVMGSLPAKVKEELGEEGDVRVVIPLYPAVRERWGDSLEFLFETTVRLAWREQYMGVYTTVHRGVRFYFIGNEYYFRRYALYGDFDDGERFAYFGKAILALLTATGFYPDVLHANDWQTAPAVIYLKRKLDVDPAFGGIKVLYTIHNIEYQGVYDFSILADVFELAAWDRPTVEYAGNINLMKGAVVCADRVNTVSPRYASEIMTDYYSAGLCHVLRMYAGKITGILNGIDTEYYNSASDPDIAATFTPEDLSGKAENKRQLQRLCGFPEDPAVPVVAMVSRLAAHKGFDLVRHIIEEFLTRNEVQFALLGTGDAELENFFRDLARRYPERAAAKTEYNKQLAKQFYAGADLFLMPSKSEPCGLAQMIASRYGAVPVVRETGGLCDTIKPYNSFTGEGNGFSFTNYNAHEMMAVMEDALRLYRDTEKWSALVRRVMQVDFSWDTSARRYIALYHAMASEP